MLYEKQNMQWNHHINALKLFKVYNTTYNYYSLWAYCVFIRSNKKPENKLHLLRLTNLFFINSVIDGRLNLDYHLGQLCEIIMYDFKLMAEGFVAFIPPITIDIPQ